MIYTLTASPWERGTDWRQKEQRREVSEVPVAVIN